MPKKKTNKEILAEFKKAHGDRYDYSMVDYKNTASKVKVMCSQHGVFEINPAHHKIVRGAENAILSPKK